MRKLLIHPVWLFLALTFAVLVFDSCKKEITSLSATHEFQPLTIGEAQQHFEENVKNKSKARTKEKHPEWDGAKMRTLSNGNLAVMVPLNRQNTYIAVSDKKMVKYGFLNYAMMYKDSDNKIVTEWVELKPSDAWFQAKKNRPYDGGIVVKNWNGKIKKILVFDNGTYTGGDKRKFPAYSKSMTSRDDMVCLVTRTLNVITKPKTCVCENHTYEQINLCTCDFGKPTPGYTTTIQVQVEASCDTPTDPVDPTGGQNEDGTPREEGDGTSGGTSQTDYPPLSCNADPNYQVPTIPPPPGTEYILPCSEYNIPAEDIPDTQLEEPTYIDLFVAEFNKHPNSSLHLSLEETQFLYGKPAIVNELIRYLFPENPKEDDLSVEAKWQIAKNHINRLMNDLDYFTFDTNHRLSSQNKTTVWWEDTEWLSNGSNFSLSSSGGDYDLTAAEQALVIAYPMHAYVIKSNVSVAISESATKWPLSASGVNAFFVNDKRDAFRHAFFNAINVRDAKVIPGVGLPAEVVVQMFAYAHEAEVPSHLELGKQMDIFNNSVGINYCITCIPLFTSRSTIADAIMQKMSNGELRYLAPLNFSTNPLYDRKNNPDCTTCSDGITSSTQMIPTNQ